jgi:hypothetical protein
MAEKTDTAPKTLEEIHADVIREKIRAGLTKEQAIEVVKAQIAWDAEQARTAKNAKP